MENGVLKVKWFTLLSNTLLTSTESSEVFSSLWNNITEETENDSTLWLSINGNIEEHLGSDGGE